MHPSRFTWSLAILAATGLSAVAAGQDVQWQPSGPAPDPRPLVPSIVEFEQDAGGWQSQAGDVHGFAFDSFFPGVGPNTPLSGTVALLDLGPLVLLIEQLDGGAALADGSTGPAVSDAPCDSRWHFSRPVYGLQTYYGSFQTGCSVAMQLYAGSTLIETLELTSTLGPVDAVGHGFLGDVPIDRIDFLSDCGADTTIVGAFVGLDSSEASLGVVHIPGYGGPGGEFVELDLAFTLTPLEAPCVQLVSLPAGGGVWPCPVGSQDNCQSRAPATSADGRWVSFMSGSDQLLPLDVNGTRDVFLADRDADGNGVMGDSPVALSLVSRDEHGDPVQAASGATATDVSDDGRTVVFSSNAQLTCGDTNPVTDVYLRDLTPGQERTILVSQGPAGQLPTTGSGEPCISGDGRYVAFTSTNAHFFPPLAAKHNNIYIRDRDVNGNAILDEPGDSTTIAITQNIMQPGNLVGGSQGPRISSDGRLVVFATATLDAWDGSAVRTEIFVHDRDADEDGLFDEVGAVSTSLISPSSVDSTSGDAQISDDGRHVIFVSDAPDLVPGDTNGRHDVFVHDLALGTTVRVSVGSSGQQAALGAGGPFLYATQRLVSLSGDGRFAAFVSIASELAPGRVVSDPQVFVHDRDADQDGVFDELHPGARRTFIASLDHVGQPSDGECAQPFLNGDGTILVFGTFADLDPTHANGTIDLWALNPLEPCSAP